MPANSQASQPKTQEMLAGPNIVKISAAKMLGQYGWMGSSHGYIFFRERKGV